MSWLDRMLRPSPTVDDPVFGRIEWNDGVWTSEPTAERPYMVNVVSRISGPFDAQRALFTRIVSSLDELIATARDYLRASDEASVTTGQMKLDIYSIILDEPADSRRAIFTIELAAADSNISDIVFGVNFHDRHPTGWYMDH